MLQKLGGARRKLRLCVASANIKQFQTLIVMCAFLDLPSLERSLLLRLNDQFPGDVGCFCVFFLNYVTLRPGESLYLAPNEPHAYLSGGINCTACCY